MNDIDTTNHYCVASQGEKLRIMNLPLLARGLDKEMALNLAAYLVTCSGATRTEFDLVRTALENT